MKKSLLVVSALAALAMLFVSCGGNSDPTVGGGDGNGGDKVANEYVLFDLADGADYDPWSQAGQFSKATLDTYIAKDADAKLVVEYKLNDFTPKYNYDGCGKIFAWKEGADGWANADVPDDFGFDTQCPIADFVVGTELKVEFKASDLISKISGLCAFAVQAWDGKVTITKIAISYAE